MKSKITIAKLTSLALLVATLTIYAANRAGAAGSGPAPGAASAQTEPRGGVTFSPGVIGIGRGQIASLHAALIGTLNTERPIEVEFMVYDQDGNVLASSRQTLLAGRATSFDTKGIIGVLRNERTDLLPCIRVLVDPTDPAVNLIVPTFEVSDNATGKTQFALSCRKSGGTQEPY
jgi:hypothetical protein